MVVKFLSRRVLQAVAGSSLALAFSSPAFAANPGATGIDASFVTMLTDLTGMLGGNFGALVLLVSLIIAAGVYAVTSNFRYVISSLLVAFLIGYGVNIIQGIGGVTATTDLVVTSLDPAAVAAVAADAVQPLPID